MRTEKMYQIKIKERVISASGLLSCYATGNARVDNRCDDLTPLYTAMRWVGSDDWYSERDLCAANDKTGSLIIPGMNQTLKNYVPFTEGNLIEYVGFMRKAWGELRKEINNLISERDKEDARGNGLPDEHRKAWAHVID